jgi:outer membrane protein assembly factor BamD (BamD/ComL family)
LIRSNQNKDGIAALQELISKHPDSGLMPRALYLIGWTCLFDQHNEEAKTNLGELVKTFPDSEYAKKARELLSGLQEGQQP